MLWIKYFMAYLKIHIRSQCIFVSPSYYYAKKSVFKRYKNKSFFRIPRARNQLSINTRVQIEFRRSQLFCLVLSLYSLQFRHGDSN